MFGNSEQEVLVLKKLNPTATKRMPKNWFVAQILDIK